MLKLNKLADYATVVLTALATAPTRVLNGQALSAQTHIPAPTVAKVLKALTRGGLVTSSRGLRRVSTRARPGRHHRRRCGAGAGRPHRHHRLRGSRQRL